MQAPDPTPFPLDHLTLRGRAGDVALIDGLGPLDYAGLEASVGSLAASLLRAGLGPGDRVATWLPKTRLTCLMPLAAARAGLVHVPINPVLRRAQAAHILADSGSALLVANAGRLASLMPGDAPDGCKAVEDGLASTWLDVAEPLPPSAHEPASLAALLYTSGSTGRPKGVMLSHANMWLGAVSVAHYLGLGPEDRTLAILPLAFDYGQNQLFSTWAAGGCAIPFDYLVPRDVVAAVRRHDVTTLAGVPPLWVQLAEADWGASGGAGVRRITNSGGAMPAPLLGRLRATFPNANIHLMYGLTEAFRSTSLDPEEAGTHGASVGQAIPFAEVLIMRSDGSLAGEGEAGEIVHCGPLVAGGYWRDPERSALRFRAAPASSRYGGLAVWSGDQATRDTAGRVTILGREDEMIKVSGNRVSPQEIEEAALASGVVAEAAAFGLPDDRLGQAIALFARGREEDGPRLAAHLRRELPAHMQPRTILWREAMPIGATGKIDRAALKRELAA